MSPALTASLSARSRPSARTRPSVEIRTRVGRDAGEAADLPAGVAVDGEDGAAGGVQQSAYVVGVEDVVAHDDQAALVVDAGESGEHRTGRAVRPARVVHHLDGQPLLQDRRRHVVATVADHHDDALHADRAQQAYGAFEQRHAADPAQHLGVRGADASPGGEDHRRGRWLGEAIVVISGRAPGDSGESGGQRCCVALWSRPGAWSHACLLHAGSMRRRRPGMHGPSRRGGGVLTGERRC